MGKLTMFQFTDYETAANIAEWPMLKYRILDNTFKSCLKQKTVQQTTKMHPEHQNATKKHNKNESKNIKNI